MVHIDPATLNHTFSKHGQDFGIPGAWTKANGTLLERAIQAHVSNPAVQQIAGTYRGTMRVIHYWDPVTDLWVAVDAANNFVAGWRLSPRQRNYLLRSGNVQ